MFVLLVVVLFAGCRCREKPQAEQPPVTGPVEVKVGSLRVKLDGATLQPRALEATFSEPKVTVKPDAVPLDAKKDPAFRHFAQLMNTKGASELLARQGLVVDANRAYDEFFELYEMNRYRPLLISSEEGTEAEDFVIKRHFLSAVPSVVTPDVVLHNLHLFFDFSVATAEMQQFSPMLRAILDASLRETKAQHAALQGTPWAAAAEDNLVFLELGRVLLASADVELPDAANDNGTAGVDTAQELADQLAGLRASVDQRLDATLPDTVKARVKVELGRVLDAKETLAPTLFAPPESFKETYSQYVPRGHYVKTRALTSYFLAMLWLSRSLMQFSSAPAVRSAVLLTLATSKPETAAKWKRVHEAISFLVGPADDLTFADVAPVIARVAQAGPLTDDAVFQQLMKELATLRPPQVQSVRTEQEHGPSLDSQRALHFFSQRAVIDAVVIQGLVDPQLPGKNTLSTLEVPAVFGAPVAKAALVKDDFAAKFPAYAARTAALSKQVRSELSARKGRELTAGWLYSIEPLLEGKASNGPKFMQTDAYGTLRLSTWMASYAELKHDTVLYAKQGLAEMGGPGFEDTEEAIDDRGYVVPELAVYARAGAVLKQLREGLTARALFPASLGESWGRFEALTTQLEAISKKELEGAALSEEDYHLIKFIGGDLEHFWEETLLIRPENFDRWMLMNDNNTRIIADVFTGPSGITHVASGWVHPVYVAFPRDGKIAIGRGAVLSFYEVTSTERLSDQRWREKVREERPPLPEWTRPVFVQDPSAELIRDDGLDR